MKEHEFDVMLIHNWRKTTLFIDTVTCQLECYKYQKCNFQSYLWIILTLKNLDKYFICLLNIRRYLEKCTCILELCKWTLN